jgi:uncharacterized membrane protein (UPF0127 family)
MGDRFATLEARELPGALTLYVARDRGARRRGLAGLESLDADTGLLIVHCPSVHTIGMRFACDLVWLDRHEQVVRIDAAVAPRRLRTCVRARSVIEVNAGRGPAFAEAWLNAP